jgi:hypothetical protein
VKINAADAAGYLTGCRRAFAALRYGAVAIELTALGTRYELVIVPCSAVADIEDHSHSDEGLYLLVTNFGAGVYIADVEAACAEYLSEKLRMNHADAQPIAEFLHDMVSGGHGQ